MRRPRPIFTSRVQAFFFSGRSLHRSAYAKARTLLDHHGRRSDTYLQSLQQQQSIAAEELQTDKSEIIKEYDRLVDGPAARKRLEKERPSLVAARDQAIVELRREKLQKETAEKPHKVARVRR